MKRAVQTALLTASGQASSEGRQQRKISFIFTPNIRERVTYKDTVVSSIPELQSFVSEILSEFKIDANLFEFDYSLLENDQLWYLKQINDE